jgi:hypothetical protein
VGWRWPLGGSDEECRIGAAGTNGKLAFTCENRVTGEASVVFAGCD